LKDTFVSGPSGLLGQCGSSTSVLLSYERVLVLPLVGASRFSNLFSRMPSPSLLQFVFENFVSILCKPYSLNCYKFLIIALSLLLNGMLQCRYFVTAIKTIIYNNIICFCLQTVAMY